KGPEHGGQRDGRDDERGEEGGKKESEHGGQRNGRDVESEEEGREKESEQGGPRDGRDVESEEEGREKESEQGGQRDGRDAKSEEEGREKELEHGGKRDGRDVESEEKRREKESEHGGQRDGRDHGGGEKGREGKNALHGRNGVGGDSSRRWERELKGGEGEKERGSDFQWDYEGREDAWSGGAEKENVGIERVRSGDGASERGLLGGYRRRRRGLFWKDLAQEGEAGGRRDCIGVEGGEGAGEGGEGLAVADRAARASTVGAVRGGHAAGIAWRDVGRVEGGEGGERGERGEGGEGGERGEGREGVEGRGKESRGRGKAGVVVGCERSAEGDWGSHEGIEMEEGEGCRVDGERGGEAGGSGGRDEKEEEVPSNAPEIRPGESPAKSCIMHMREAVRHVTGCVSGHGTRRGGVGLEQGVSHAAPSPPPRPKTTFSDTHCPLNATPTPLSMQLSPSPPRFLPPPGKTWWRIQVATTDMVAHSRCDYGEEREEQEQLRQYWEKAWGVGREGNVQHTPQQLRAAGKCPLTPEEAGLVLAALEFSRHTRLYVASYQRVTE
ncbi:unnamed protein product, partial [Closterium sp. Naga37s-1]